jgi:hypothetical protein
MFFGTTFPSAFKQEIPMAKKAKTKTDVRRRESKVEPWQHVSDCNKHWSDMGEVK